MASGHSSAQAAWWYQHYQTVHAANVYQPRADHDATWTYIDLSMTDPTRDLLSLPSDYTARPSGECTDTQALTQEWYFAGYSHGLRYMSPIESYGSHSPSTTYSADSTFTNDLTTYPIRHSASPVNASEHNTLEPSEFGNAQLHMLWQSELRSPVGQFAQQTVPPGYLPLRPTKATKFQDDHFMQLKSDYEDDVMIMHTNSPMQMPQPEVLELSETTTDTPASPSSDDFNVTVKLERESKQLVSENGFEEDDESMAIDDDRNSDSDYQARPKRRSSRNTGCRAFKSPTHRRKSSSHAVLETNARVHKRNSSTTATAANHVRRPSKSKPKKGPVFAKSNTNPAQLLSKSDRVFPCTFHHFGCQAEFPNKNEWKRHVACQHLQLGYYRCDLGDCDPDNGTVSADARVGNSRRQSSQATNPQKKGTSIKADDEEEIVKIYNDFNRKDLFTQHARRMHGPTRNPELCTSPHSSTTTSSSPRSSSTSKKIIYQATKEDEAAFEHELAQIRARCWHVRRKAPARSTCGICHQVFDAVYYTNCTTASAGNPELQQGPEDKAWEERMEHLGRHYEKEAVAIEMEDLDDDLVAWGLSCGVLQKLEDGRPWLMLVEPPGSQEKTVRRRASGNGGRHRLKARRQPSRTVVVQKKDVAVREGDVSDEDADGEDE